MDINRTLREAYDKKAIVRDKELPKAFKVGERNIFLALLLKEGKASLLEIGAGPGRDSLYFKNQGIDVVCVDFSCEMVKLCREKGLIAHQMDVRNLTDLNGSFDAVFTLNCLLHLPRIELPVVLKAIHEKLNPNGLFYMGLYGGRDQEGIWEQDTYEPKRFFSFYSDDRIKNMLNEVFDIHSFRQIPNDDPSSDIHFQSIILRKERR